MAAPSPKDTAVFLHGDFLPVNMLWSRGRITGLTDWNGIHRGSSTFRVFDLVRLGVHVAVWAAL